MGVQFERGDLILFRHEQDGRETQSGGIVIDLDDGLLTMALPQGVEVWNMRSPRFGSAWRVEHAPAAMSEVEALTFAVRRLAELRRHPLVLVEPEDDRPFTAEPHAPLEPLDHSHEGRPESEAHGYSHGHPHALEERAS